MTLITNEEYLTKVAEFMSIRENIDRIQAWFAIADRIEKCVDLKNAKPVDIIHHHRNEC